MFSLQSDIQFCMKSAVALFWLAEGSSGLCLLGQGLGLCVCSPAALHVTLGAGDGPADLDCTGITGISMGSARLFFSQAVAPWPLEQLALISSCLICLRFCLDLCVPHWGKGCACQE